jgi:hypothetical protein
MPASAHDKGEELITKAKAIVRLDGTAVDGASLARPWQGPVRRLALLAIATAALLALAAAPASALTTHVFSTSFGSSGSGDGQLSSPQGVAVNSTSHDLYVADTGNARIDQFTSTGTFIRAFGADVGGSGVDVCTSGCVAGTPGSAPGAFTTPAFISIDNSAGPSAGDVYVADSATHLVSKFDSTGNLITAWASGGQLSGSTATDGPFGQLAGVAVDGSGNLFAYDTAAEMFEFAQDATFVTDFNSGFGVSLTGISVDSPGNLYIVRGSPFVQKISSSGSDLGQITADPNATGLAADPSTGDLYVDNAGNLIDHYDSSCDPSVSSPCAVADSFGSAHLSGAAGLAVDSSTHAVFAADTGNARVDAFTGPVTLPDVSTGSATNVGPTAATLDGTVNPDAIALTDCHFDYVPDSQFQSDGYQSVTPAEQAPCVPDAASIPVDSTDHAVSADVSGLTAGVTYHFRLEAANANGSNAGADATFTTPPPPSIDAVAAANLTATEADLTAEINPNGADTTYHFEYGTDTSYGTSVPVPDGDIGSGTTDVAVSQHITGLTPDTTYHYRLVATNASGTVGATVDHTFIYDTTGQGLPDGRAYEQVTPPHKNGATIGNALFALPTTVSASGERLTATSIQCFADASSCNGIFDGVEGSPFAFTRAAGGWQTNALAPPADQFTGSVAFAISPDTGAGLFETTTQLSGPQHSWYYRQPDGSFVAVGPLGPPSVNPGLPNGAQATADLSRMVWNQTAPVVWPFDATGSFAGSVYEYVGTGNSQPLLVGVGGPNDGPGSTDLIGTCGTETFDAAQAMSSDGRTVYFTVTGPCPGGSGANAGTPVPADALYARIDESSTVPISQPSPSDCTGACQSSPPSDAVFNGASADGSRAYFTSTQRLTDAATEDNTAGDSALNCPTATGPNGCNLYLYDSSQPAGHELTAVSAGDSPRVQGVMATSPDGSHAYFVARGVLTTDPNALGQTAMDGAENAYLYERDASHPAGHLSFVASLSASDSPNQIANANFARRVNVTPDGRFLVFTSHAQLTPDDTSQSGASQVFRYDAQTGDLIRISIGDNGFNDNGNRSTAAPFEDAQIVGQGHGNRSDPTMSDDGASVFFISPVALAPRALDDVQAGLDPNNKVIYAQNVYEWHAGHVHLISDGRDAGVSPTPSCDTASAVCLLGTDATGQNVFFSTLDRLVPQDTDTQLDYYDARVGGGFPFTPPPEPCNGDNCKPPPSGAPTDPTPGSSSLSGPGNQGKNLGRIPATKKKCKKHKGKKRCKKSRKSSARAANTARRADR